MEKEYAGKAACYEQFIRKSMKYPWSPKQLPVENAYWYYCLLVKQEKTATAEKVRI